MVTTLESAEQDDPGQASRHHRVGSGPRRQEDADGGIPGLEPLALHHGNRGQCDLFLPYEIAGPGTNPAGQILELLGIEPIGEDRLEPAVGEGRLDDHPRQLGKHVTEPDGFPAPPRFRPGQLQVLSQELAADGRKIGQQRRGLDQTAPQRIGHGDVAGPQDLEQSRDSQEGTAPQLERIAIVIIDAAENHVHGLESAQELQINAIAADQQIAPLDQGVAQVSGQEGVLEVGLVVRPWRQQDDAGIVAVVGRDRL